MKASCCYSSCWKFQPFRFPFHLFTDIHHHISYDMYLSSHTRGIPKKSGPSDQFQTYSGPLLALRSGSGPSPEFPPLAHYVWTNIIFFHFPLTHYSNFWHRNTWVLNGWLSPASSSSSMCKTALQSVISYISFYGHDWSGQNGRRYHCRHGYQDWKLSGYMRCILKVKYLCRDKTVGNGTLPLPDSRSGGIASFSSWILLCLKCFNWKWSSSVELNQTCIYLRFCFSTDSLPSEGFLSQDPSASRRLLHGAYRAYMMIVKNYPSRHLLISLGPVFTLVVATNEPGCSLFFQIHFRYFEVSKYCDTHLSNFCHSPL